MQSAAPTQPLSQKKLEELIKKSEAERVSIVDSHDRTPKPLDLETKEIIRPDIRKRLVAGLKKQECETAFDQLLDRLSQFNVETESASANEPNVFYTRLVPLINNYPPTEANKIVNLVELYFVNVFEELTEEKNDPEKRKLKAALILLDNDITTLSSILKTSLDQDGLIDISDISDTPVDKQAIEDPASCTDDTIKTDESKADGPIQKLQKRLYKGNIYVDESGRVYWLAGERRALETISEMDRTSKFVSLTTGINYKIICHYLFLIQILQKHRDLNNFFGELFIRGSKKFQAQVTSFILALAKHSAQEHVLKNYLKSIHDALCQSPEDQCNFFKSLDFTTANELLNLFVKHGFLIERAALFNSSALSPLLTTDVLQEYAEMTFGIVTKKAVVVIAPRLEQKEESEKKVEKELKQEKDQTESTLQDYSDKQLEADLLKYSSGAIRAEAFYRLSQYKQTHLKEVSEENHGHVETKFKGKRKVPNRRGKAYLRLINSLNKLDCWAEFNDLSYRLDFQNQAGKFKVGLVIKTAAPFPLWPEVEYIYTQIQAQEKLMQKFADIQLLTRVISTDKFYKLLRAEDLYFIFENCNKKIFLELLLKHNRIQKNWKKREFAVFFNAPSKRKRFFRLFKDDALLTQAMSNDTFYQTLKLEDLNDIFLNCNQGLFIRLAKQFNRLDKTLDISHHQKLDPQTLVLMADESSEEKIALANQRRLEYKIEQNIPDGFTRPGRREAVETLPKELLYQFVETDINSIENILIQKYYDLFINKFQTKAEQKRVTAEFKGEKLADVSFYYIPITTQPILIDPDKKSDQHSASFNEFSERLRTLLDSHDPIKHQKPVIFCGIASVNGVHYIPYFIYKNNKNQIQVICIDPSPQSKVWSEATPAGARCLKQGSSPFLKKVFNHIFKDCEFYDPNVTQQLRERDCAPNSATTVEDAFRLATTHTPLLEIRDDKLHIHPERLTVNFNGKRLLNHQDGYFYYSPTVVDIGKANRDRWALQLTTVHTVVYTSIESPKMTLDTPYSFVSLGDEYNYARNVNEQKVDDKSAEIRSTICALLIDKNKGTPDSVKMRFFKTFTIPNADEIRALVSSIERHHDIQSVLNSQTRGQELTLFEIIEGIYKSIEKDCREEALVEHFKLFLNKYYIKDLNKQKLSDIVNEFLNVPEIYEAHVKHLGSLQKDTLVQRLNKKYEPLYSERVAIYHENIIKNQLLKELHNLPDPGKFVYLNPLNSKLSIDNTKTTAQLLNNILRHFSAKGTLEDSVVIAAKAKKKQETEIINEILHTIIEEAWLPTLKLLKQQISKMKMDDVVKLELKEGPNLLSDSFHQFVRNTFPDPVAEGKEIKRSLFVRLMANEIDVNLCAAFDRHVDSLLRPEIEKVMESKEWETLTDSQINAILEQEATARQKAEQMGLYAVLDKIKHYDSFYQKACTKLIEFVREKAIDVLPKRMDRVRLIILNQYFQLAKERLDSVFVNREEKLSTEILQSLVHDLSLCEDVPQDDRILLQGLSKNSINSFIKKHGDEILKELAHIHISARRLQVNAQVHLEQVKQIQSLFDNSDELKDMATELESIQGIAESLPYFSHKKSQHVLIQMQEASHRIFKNLINLLLKDYVKYDRKPNTYTAKARPILCKLFNLSKGIVVTEKIDAESAQIFDDAIFREKEKAFGQSFQKPTSTRTDRRLLFQAEAPLHISRKPEMKSIPPRIRFSGDL